MCTLNNVKALDLDGAILATKTVSGAIKCKFQRTILGELGDLGEKVEKIIL